jgi:hypothetical protein
MIFRNGQAAAYSSFRRIGKGHSIMQPIHHSASRTMQLGIPAYGIEAFGRRTVPHGGFAAVQDDIATRGTKLP